MQVHVGCTCTAVTGGLCGCVVHAAREAGRQQRERVEGRLYVRRTLERDVEWIGSDRPLRWRNDGKERVERGASGTASSPFLSIAEG